MDFAGVFFTWLLSCPLAFLNYSFIWMPQRWRKRSSFWWFTYHMAISDRSGPGSSQEPGLSPRSLTRVIKGQSTWVIFYCYTWLISRDLNQTASSWNSNLHSDMGCEHHTVPQPTLPQNLLPMFFFSRKIPHSRGLKIPFTFTFSFLRSCEVLFVFLSSTDV